MEILQGVLKQHLRPRAVVGYGVKFFLPSPPNYVTRSPGIMITKKDNILTKSFDFDFKSLSRGLRFSDTSNRIEFCVCD